MPNLERDDFWLNRPVDGIAARLPLAGEHRPPSAAVQNRTPKLSFGYGARKSAAGGEKSILSTSAFCGSTPTPTLPREEREREYTSIAGPTRPNLIML